MERLQSQGYALRRAARRLPLTWRPWYTAIHKDVEPPASPIVCSGNILAHEHRYHSTMNLTWTSRDPFNSSVVDDASGQVVFTTCWPSSFTKQSIAVLDARGQVVGEYESRFSSDSVTYQGQRHTLAKWLKKKHWNSGYVAFLSDKRLFWDVLCEPTVVDSYVPPMG